MANSFAPDWMSSDQFQLSAKGSDAKLNIHEGLLSRVAKQINSKGFKEGNLKHYVFEDTTETTIMQFIEWAYTRNYSLQTRSASWKSEDEHDNDLITHARVYIFGDVYGIEKMKELALTYLTGEIEAIAPMQPGGNASYYFATNRPGEMDKPRLKEVVALFYLCFNRLCDEDRLLIWLGRFAAWRIHELCQEPIFLALLPQMSSHVFPTVNRAVKPPWVSRDPFSNDSAVFRCTNCSVRYEEQVNTCSGCSNHSTVRKK